MRRSISAAGPTFAAAALAVLGLLVVGMVCPVARAVSCTVAAAMTGQQRLDLFEAAHQLGGTVLRGDVPALKNGAVASLAANFDGIADTVTTLAPSLVGATLTVENLYSLDASDLQGTQDDVQFFCGVAGAPLLVTVTLGQLPKGQYALAVLHATGVKAPQQFAMVLENAAASGAAPQWKLAGFFARPLTMDGHESSWFWQQARVLKNEHENWSAFFYDQAAAYLARPGDLYTSNNLEKLSRETAAVEPAGLPGNTPMQVAAEGETFAVTGLRVDPALGALDLRVNTRVESVADPVQARAGAIRLMTALLQQHPGLRANFHGLWVYETTAANQSFAVEQPVTAIP
jgi:hypothetical protein